MHRKILLACLTTAAVALLATAAFAQGPSFQGGATGGVMQGPNLVINFQEIGLLSGSTTNLVVTGTVDASTVCVNHAGKVPAAQNKQLTTTTAPITSQVFTGVSSDGTLSGSIILDPTIMQGALSCPGGLTTTVVSVTYTNVQIVDQTNNVVLSIPGTFTYTNPQTITYLRR